MIKRVTLDADSQYPHGCGLFFLRNNGIFSTSSTFFSFYELLRDCPETYDFHFFRQDYPGASFCYSTLQVRRGSPILLPYKCMAT